MARRLALLLLPGLLAAQVIFSRRVYREHGRSYQQIWVWNAADGSLQPLTRSPLDHTQPMCSRDGRQVLFVSSSDDEAEQSVWSLDRASGEERELWSARPATSAALVGIAQDGAPLVEREWMVRQSILARLYKGGPHPFQFAGDNEVSLSPDGIHLVGFTETDPGTNPSLAFVTDTATGNAHVTIGKCGQAVWSPDGTHIACSSGFVTDGATGKSRVSIGECDLASLVPCRKSHRVSFRG
ncbi:MAG: hypothetical protein ABSG65_18555 [Bryobacteraceae bacterium]|jgi:Tol biopolymer transport system component